MSHNAEHTRDRDMYSWAGVSVCVCLCLYICILQTRPARTRSRARLCDPMVRCVCARTRGTITCLHVDRVRGAHWGPQEAQNSLCRRRRCAERSNNTQHNTHSPSADDSLVRIAITHVLFPLGAFIRRVAPFPAAIRRTNTRSWHQCFVRLALPSIDGLSKSPIKSRCSLGSLGAMCRWAF